MARSQQHRRFLLYRALSIRAYVPFLLYFLQGRGLSLATVFDLHVVFILASVVLEVPAGLLADRRGRRFAMVLGGLLMTTASVVFILGRSFAWYSLANALCAFSMALSTAADSVWLYEQAETSEAYTRAEGYSNAAKSTGNLLAILVAGAVFSLSPAGPFVLSGALTLLSSVAAYGLVDTHSVAPNRGVLHALRSATQLVSDNGRLLLVMAFGAVTFTLLQLSLFADPAHLPMHLDTLNAAEIALALAALSSAKELLTAITSAATGALFSRARAAVVVTSVALGTVAVFVLMGRQSHATCLVAMLCVAALFGVFQPLERALMNRAITDDQPRATLFSLESVGRRLTFAFASALFGRAAESASLHGALRATAFLATFAYIILAMGAAGWLSVLRRKPTQSDPLTSYL